MKAATLVAKLAKDTMVNFILIFLLLDLVIEKI